jgi:hypothetical protein
LDNTSIVSRRIGFVPVPLVAIVLHVFTRAVPNLVPFSSIPMAILIYVIGFCCIFAMKVWLSVVIVGYAAKKLSKIKNEDQGDVKSVFDKPPRPTTSVSHHLYHILILI